MSRTILIGIGIVLPTLVVCAILLEFTGIPSIQSMILERSFTSSLHQGEARDRIVGDLQLHDVDWRNGAPTTESPWGTGCKGADCSGAIQALFFRRGALCWSDYDIVTLKFDASHRLESWSKEESGDGC